MALQLSGPISIGNINVELGRSSSTVNTSINEAQNGLYGIIRQASTYKPSPNNQASLSEWYGYQHVLDSISGNLIVGNYLAYYGYASGGYGSLTFGAGYTFSNGSVMIQLAYRTSNSTIYISFSNGSTTVEPLWTDISFNGSSFAKSSFTLSHAGGSNTWYYTRFSVVNPIGTTVGSSVIVNVYGTNSGSDTTAPSTPTGVSLSNIGSTQLDISWNSSTDNVAMAGYYIYINGSTTPAYEVNLTGSGTFGQTITGLSPSTSYYFTIKARDTSGNLSAAATSATITTNAGTDTVAPSAPSSANATNIGSTTLTLNWSASTDNVGVTNYLVYKNGVLLATLGNVITYGVTGLTASTSYAFTIYAKDAAGNTSNVSNTVNVSTIAGSGDTTPPSMPTDLWTQAFGDYLEIYWTASTDNVGVVGYDLEFSYSPTGPWNNLGSTTNSFFGFLVFYDTYYYIRVKANDNSGNTSGWAEIGSWTETDPNNAPY